MITARAKINAEETDKGTRYYLEGCNKNTSEEMRWMRHNGSIWSLRQFLCLHGNVVDEKSRVIDTDGLMSYTLLL